jgi:hypothetical protein
MNYYNNAVEALVYFTDCAIATHNYDGQLKSTSKSRRERLHSIAVKMLEACKACGAKAKDLERLEKRLKVE